jgi:hypothetical protein
MQFLENATEPLRIVIEENPLLPEVARIPWELAFGGDTFLAADPFTPIIRQPTRTRPVNSITIHCPLRMALISASPQDQHPLMVEEELINVALSLDEQITEGRLLVDEIMNCTREKLSETLRANRYDIVYFTGHGCFTDDTGFLALEAQDKFTDPLSANDFAAALRPQREVSLLFLNCCNSAAVGEVRQASWEGFGDVARKAMKHGVPQVVATQSAVFDSTGRKLMKVFFEEICRDGDFDVTAALTQTRCTLESDQSQYHDFYQFVHLSTLTKNATIEVKKTAPEELNYSNWQGNVVSHTSNRMDIERNFVGRFSYATGRHRP